jgi:hypothetical protein
MDEDVSEKASLRQESNENPDEGECLASWRETNLLGRN